MKGIIVIMKHYRGFIYYHKPNGFSKLGVFTKVICCLLILNPKHFNSNEPQNIRSVLKDDRSVHQCKWSVNVPYYYCAAVNFSLFFCYVFKCSYFGCIYKNLKLLYNKKKIIMLKGTSETEKTIFNTYDKELIP